MTKTSIKKNRTESLDEFTKFHDEFSPSSEYFDDYDLDNDELGQKSWFDKVQNNHINIRERIGGTSLELKFDIKNSQIPSDKTKCDRLWRQLCRYIPGIEDYLEADKHINFYLFDKLPNGKKLSKVIKNFATDEYDGGFISEIGKKEVEKILSKFGEEWSLAKTKDQTLYARFSTKAEDFMRLGHYGPDNKSCFRNYKDRYYDKYDLAKLGGTFVLTISEKPNDYISNSARMWGFYSESNCVNFCNHYYAPKFHYGNAIKICKKFSEIILNKKDIVTCYDIIEVMNIYLNERGINLTCYSKSDYEGEPNVQYLR